MTRRRDRLGAGFAKLLAAASLAFPLVAAAGVPRATVGCDDWVDVDPPPAPTTRDHVVLDRVALPRRMGLGARQAAPLSYWAKAPLLVRPGRSPVDIVVPAAWRDRAAISWGNSGRVRELRVLGCASPQKWLVYAGGFHLQRPACLPLVVRAAGRSAALRVGIGVSC